MSAFFFNFRSGELVSGNDWHFARDFSASRKWCSAQILSLKYSKNGSSERRKRIYLWISHSLWTETVAYALTGIQFWYTVLVHFDEYKYAKCIGWRVTLFWRISIFIRSNNIQFTQTICFQNTENRMQRRQRRITNDPTKQFYRNNNPYLCNSIPL